MRIGLTTILLAVALAVTGAATSVAAPLVRVGLERLDSAQGQTLKGKRVGLIANAASVTADGRSSAQALRAAGVPVSSVDAGDPPSGARAVRLAVQRVSANGRVLPKAILSPMIGGGGTAVDVLFPLVQNGLTPREVAQRPDGSYLVAGSVSVLRRTEGGSYGPYLPAVAAFTNGFAPDRSFGGPRRAPAMTVRTTDHYASTSAARGFIPLRLTASVPGIVRLTIRDVDGHLIGQRVAPIFAAGSSFVRILLDASAHRLLRGPQRRVRITHEFRDVVAQIARATRVVRLR